MTDANNIFATAVPAIGAVIADFYSHLAPWLLLGMVLVLVDLRYGVLAARRRGENIRFSRAWRRTINKMLDYLCWVTVAELMSRTFAVSLGVPVVSISMLFVIYGIEVSSCVNNYFEYKGIRKRFNFWKLLNRKEIDDAIEEEKGGEA
jgi:hypothetical protein